MKILKSKYSSLDDSELMTMVANGNEAAFSKIYDKWSKPILNYFYKMLWQDQQKAQDFTQDLFTKIIHKPKLYNTSKSFKTWIYTVAYNMCKNEYRKQETRRNASSELFKQNINIESNKSDNSYDKKIFRKRLNQELDQLSVSHKKVFIMRMKHNLSIKEIAEIMETSEGTIKSRIFYTLKKLSENLKEFNPASSVALILLINELLFNS